MEAREEMPAERQNQLTARQRRNERQNARRARRRICGWCERSREDGRQVEMLPWKTKTSQFEIAICDLCKASLPQKWFGRIIS